MVLDSLDGHLRADVLAHLASCPACRTEVRELAEVADAMVLLAPAVEPSPGFADRVLDAMTAESPSPVVPLHARRRWRVGHVIAAAVAASLLAVVGTVAIVGSGSRNEKAVTLNGRFRSVAMVGQGGIAQGDAYVSTGTDPWLLVDVNYWLPTQGFRLVGVENSGAVVDIGRMHKSDDHWGWAGRFKGVDTLTELRVLDTQGQVVCRATVTAPSS
jgi:anti-sigma factor RsiW